MNCIGEGLIMPDLTAIVPIKALTTTDRGEQTHAVVTAYQAVHEGLLKMKKDGVWTKEGPICNPRVFYDQSGMLDAPPISVSVADIDLARLKTLAEKTASGPEGGKDKGAER